MKNPKLLTPGPVDVFDEVIAAMGQQVPHMSTERWMHHFHETVAMLKQVFQTENDLFVLTSPGSGCLEAGICGLFQPGDRVLIVRNGLFGERLERIASLYRCEIIPVDAPWGRAVDPEKVAAVMDQHPDLDGIAVVGNETSTGVRNPLKELAALAHERDMPILADLISGMGGYDVPVDEWGLDITVTSSNKAMEMAPGLGLISVSPRAWALIDAKAETAIRGQYYNLSIWKEVQERVSFPFPSTPPTSAVMGMHASLKRILEHETLPGHWARYSWAQQAVRRGMEALGFEMLVPEEEASFTVTTIRKHACMESTQELVDYLLQEHDFLISGGLGKIAGETMRIGHMGLASTQEYLEAFLLGVEAFLRQRGIDVKPGAGLVGLQTAPKSTPKKSDSEKVTV